VATVGKNAIVRTMNTGIDKDLEKKRRRAARNAAFSLQVDLPPGEEVRELIGRENGLFCIAPSVILRLRSPDSLDPGLNHDAPWEQSIYLPHGATDPLVARTVLQTLRLLEPFFPKNSDKYTAVMDLS
jgi:hypothetical protein